jgi:hypothetical protein
VHVVSIISISLSIALFDSTESTAFRLSIIGRAMLVNFMIHSVPRYWVQIMAAPAPASFHKYLEDKL